eukprot:6737577-Alexandrium_andersonii.AAC.1
MQPPSQVRAIGGPLSSASARQRHSFLKRGWEGAIGPRRGSTTNSGNMMQTAFNADAHLWVNATRWPGR